MSFYGDVPTVWNADCCTANSCLGAYLATNAVIVSKGSRIKFSYKAEKGDDWYEAAIVLFEGIPSNLSGATIIDSILVRGDVIPKMQYGEFTITKSGTYFVGFFAASYDRSGGGALGATWYHAWLGT